MDFFAQQDRTRRRSRVLIAIFVIAVLSTVAATDAVVALGHHLIMLVIGARDTAIGWDAIIKLSLFQIAVIVLAGVYRMLKLRGGGVSLVWDTGALLAEDYPDKTLGRRLCGVVEEMAIASGVPVPEVFVMENEPGINAFAAGYSAADAAICVTDGVLVLLNRDELQAVVAHEFSHILNGDIRLNIRLISGLFAIMGVGWIGHKMVDTTMHLGSARGQRGTATDASMLALLLLVGLVAITYGFFGSLFGRLVQAAILRSRESLADASAVQFTRQTQGIAGALMKMAACRSGSRLTQHDVHELTHMMLGSPLGWRWFDSHPPLADRIRALGVRWSESGRKRMAEKLNRLRRDAKLGRLDEAPASKTASLQPSAALASASMLVAAASVQLDTPAEGVDKGGQGGAALEQKIGHPEAADFLAASELLQQLPQAVTKVLRDPWQVAEVLLALALDDDAKVRLDQQKIIHSMFGPAIADASERLHQVIRRLPPNQRLPLATLTFPALRRQSAVHVERLLATTLQLVRADGHVSVHEFCLQRLMQVQLKAMLYPHAHRRARHKSLQDCREDVAMLCAIVAMRGGSADKSWSTQALAGALAQLFPGWHGQVRVPEDWRKALDQCLASLEGLRDQHRAQVVKAVAQVIHHDQQVTLSESELFRVISMSLECPMPLLYSA